MARLGLTERLQDGPRTVAELASLMSSDRDGLGRLLRASAAFGLFTELGDERFELTNSDYSSAPRTTRRRLAT